MHPFSLFAELQTVVAVPLEKNTAIQCAGSFVIVPPFPLPVSGDQDSDSLNGWVFSRVPCVSRSERLQIRVPERARASPSDWRSLPACQDAVALFAARGSILRPEQRWVDSKEGTPVSFLRRRLPLAVRLVPVEWARFCARNP